MTKFIIFHRETLYIRINGVFFETQMIFDKIHRYKLVFLTASSTLSCFLVLEFLLHKFNTLPSIYSFSNSISFTNQITHSTRTVVQEDATKFDRWPLFLFPHLSFLRNSFWRWYSRAGICANRDGKHPVVVAVRNFQQARLSFPVPLQPSFAKITGGRRRPILWLLPSRFVCFENRASMPTKWTRSKKSTET